MVISLIKLIAVLCYAVMRLAAALLHILKELSCILIKVSTWSCDWRNCLSWTNVNCWHSMVVGSSDSILVVWLFKVFFSLSTVDFHKSFDLY